MADNSHQNDFAGRIIIESTPRGASITMDCNYTGHGIGHIMQALLVEAAASIPAEQKLAFMMSVQTGLSCGSKLINRIDLPEGKPN